MTGQELYERIGRPGSIWALDSDMLIYMTLHEDIETGQLVLFELNNNNFVVSWRSYTSHIRHLDHLNTSKFSVII